MSVNMRVIADDSKNERKDWIHLSSFKWGSHREGSSSMGVEVPLMCCAHFSCIFGHGRGWLVSVVCLVRRRGVGVLCLLILVPQRPPSEGYCGGSLVLGEWRA